MNDLFLLVFVLIRDILQLPTQLKNVVTNTLKGGSIFEPFTLDPMNVHKSFVTQQILLGIRVVDTINAWLDESVKHDNTLLVDE